MNVSSLQGRRSRWLAPALCAAGASQPIVAAIEAALTALQNTNGASGYAESQFVLGGGIDRHVARVGALAHHLALAAGCSSYFAMAIGIAAPLHDIAKLALPDALLHKQGPLTAEETQVIRSHAELGARILRGRGLPLLDLAAEIALCHHESWDGSGYPRGLAGERIPLEGRIVGIADVFDALLSRRPYKDAWPAEAVRVYLAEGAGNRFDPRLADLFLADWDIMMAKRSKTVSLSPGPLHAAMTGIDALGMHAGPAWARLRRAMLTWLPDGEILRRVV